MLERLWAKLKNADLKSNVGAARPAPPFIDPSELLFQPSCRNLSQALLGREARNVLDLSCGEAALGRVLRFQGYTGRYTGVESRAQQLEVATAALLALGSDADLMIHSDILQLPFSKRSYECVVLSEVLERRADFRPALKEATRLCDRYLLISNSIPWTKHDTHIKKNTLGQYRNQYNRQEIYDFLGAQGFAVEEVISNPAAAWEMLIFSRALFADSSADSSALKSGR